MKWCLTSLIQATVELVNLISKVQRRNHFSVPDGVLTIVLQLSPHIRIVCRRGDPNKTEYIAKHLHEGSNGLIIHEYLQSRPSESPYIISFIEAVPSTTTALVERAILSWSRECGSFYQSCPQLPANGSWMKMAPLVVSRLGWGLIEGLAYLQEHSIAHRDIQA